MAIFQGMCTSFKVGLLKGEFDFGPDTAQTFRIALYTANANLSVSTTHYTTVNEVVGDGYVAGGEVLTVSQPPASSGTVAYFNFDNAVWPNASITARGALIYLADGVTNPAVAVLDFGADKTTSGVDFVVQFPPTSANSAILRIA